MLKLAIWRQKNNARSSKVVRIENLTNLSGSKSH